MVNMICALVLTRKLASIIMIATAALIMLLIVFFGPKSKANAKYDADLDKTEEQDEQPIEEESVVEQPVEEIAEPVAEVAEEPVEEVAEEPVAEVVEEAVVEEAVESAEEQPVEEVVEEKEEAVAEPVVEEVPVEVAEQAEQEVAATETKGKLNIPVGKKRTFAEKMCEADEENQAIYNLLKNELMSYKKVSNRLTKVIDIFQKLDLLAKQ